MNDGLKVFASKLARLTEEVHAVYASLVDDICQKGATEDEVVHLLDWLLDPAYDDNIFTMYKSVCRNYVYKYPKCFLFIYSEAACRTICDRVFTNRLFFGEKTA